MTEFKALFLFQVNAQGSEEKPDFEINLDNKHNTFYPLVMPY